MTNLLLDFPEIRQSHDYNCGVSAVQAILYYYGFSFREDKLEHLLKTTPKTGTNPSQIIDLFRRIGFRVRAKQLMTLNDIRKALKNRIPILVPLQAWGQKRNYQNCWNSGHYSIIIGLMDQKIIFEDPSLIGKGFLTVPDFLSRWHDIDSEGHRYQHYGLLISGLPVKYSSTHLIPIL